MCTAIRGGKRTFPTYYLCVALLIKHSTQFRIDFSTDKEQQSGDVKPKH